MRFRRLSWHDARTCWKKFYRGKHYYIGKGLCKCRSDKEGYRIALCEWEELKRELDRLHAIREGTYRQQSYLTGVAGTRPGTSLDLACAMATDWSSSGARPSVSSMNRNRIRGTNIRGLMEDFLRIKKVALEAGVISPKMYIQYKDKLEEFVGWTEHADIGVAKAGGINSLLLADYRQRQMELLAGRTPGERGNSSWTIKKRLAAVNQFVRWLWQHEVIETLPRVLDKAFLAVPLAKPNPKFFSVEEVKKLFNSSSQRTKVYIALALNCGYRQTDISKLRHEHVNWQSGIIRRERHKTGVQQCHKLWNVTKDLLEREKSAGSEGILLLTEDGKELYRERISDEGKFLFCDVIRLAFDRLMLSSGMDTALAKDRRRFETFRDTGSNLIEKHFQNFPHLSSQYLAHKETAMKDRYVERHFDLLFSALDKMESLLDLQLPNSA